MNLVVDASIVGAWILPDERTPAAEKIASLIDESSAWVPQLFAIEIANVVLVAERRKRISQVYADEQIALLERMPLRVDGETGSKVWHITHQLARAEDLTVYDATYLELALRLGANIATLDIGLTRAARRRGLTVLP